MKVTSTRADGAHPIKCLIYGESGIGKTTLASTTPNVLFIGAEAGELSLSSFDIDKINVAIDDNGKVLDKSDRLTRIREVYRFVMQKETMAKYKTIFIDSLTEISQIVSEKAQVDYPNKSDAFKLWGEYKKEVCALVKAFRDLPHYNVVFTALSKRADKDDPFMSVDVQGSVGVQIAQFFDEVFYYSIILDQGVQKRVLHTSKNRLFVAKDRSGKLNAIEDPNLGLIFEKINKIG